MNPYEATNVPATIAGGQVLTISKIDVISAGRMLGGVYGAFGLLLAALMLVFTVFAVGLSLVGVASGAEGAGPLAGGLLTSLAFAVFMPLFYGGIGFIGGILSAAIYNLAASWFGGLAFTVS